LLVYLFRREKGLSSLVSSGVIMNIRIGSSCINVAFEYLQIRTEDLTGQAKEYRPCFVRNTAGISTLSAKSGAKEFNYNLRRAALVSAAMFVALAKLIGIERSASRPYGGSDGRAFLSLCQAADTGAGHCGPGHGQFVAMLLPERSTMTAMPPGLC
jgi:hypothetical protein